MLTITRLTKTYPPAHRALDDLSLQVAPGVFGLLGPNGAGKSTLMGILAGELAFDGGRVEFGGVDLRRRPLEWKRRLGFMPQTLDFPPHLSGWEVLKRTALMQGLSPRGMRGRMEELLGQVRLLDAAKREAHRYSRGMKQRLALAAALLGDPELLLLDEPTSGLDPEERIVFRELLSQIGGGRVVILSTHIVADVERCCGRIGVLAGGRLLFEGEPHELIRRVESRVLEVEIADESQLDGLVEGGRVAGLGNRDGRIVARMVLAEPVGEAEDALAPTLEDGYMDLIASAPPEEAPAA
ncbi:MAG: ATP-binding cassette domain-containing protein [Sumerlaeia bacterium]